MITNRTKLIIDNAPKGTLSLIPFQHPEPDNQWSATLWYMDRTPSGTPRPRMLLSDDRKWKTAPECLKQMRITLKEFEIEIGEEPKPGKTLRNRC